MTLLDRYLTRTVIIPTAVAFLVVSFVIVANELKAQISSVVIQFLTARDVVLLGSALLPTLLPLILPASLLFGVLTGYGRLAERGELTAMRAAGVSLLRIVSPAIAVGLAATVGTLALQDLLLPHTMGFARRMLLEELPRRATLDTISPGVMHPFGDWRVYFKSRDVKAHRLHEVVVVRQEPGKGAVVYHADSAAASRDESGPTLLLGRGYWVSPDGIRASCDSVLLHLPPPLTSLGPHPSSAASTLGELLEIDRALSRELAASKSLSLEKKLRRARSTFAERVSLPFGAILFACIGAPLAVESARYRRGSRQRLLASGLLPLFAYYFLHTALQSSSLMSLNTTLLRAWIPNALLAGAAAAMLARAARVH